MIEHKHAKYLLYFFKIFYSNLHKIINGYIVTRLTESLDRGEKSWCSHCCITNSSEFEDLAIGVLNKCYSVNEHRGQDLLIREMPNWGNATCVLIALQADNKRFISQTACQSLLNSIWMGSLSQDNSLWRVSVTLNVCTFKKSQL